MSNNINCWCVYKHTNKINGKSYIGITCKTTKIRWGNYGYRYLLKYPNGKFKHPAFAAAIQKYGWENFTHKILYSNLTEQEAKEKECKLISKYHTYIKDPQCNGYNMTIGGDGYTKYNTKAEADQALKIWQKEYYSRPDIHAKKLSYTRASQAKRKLDIKKHKKDLASSARHKLKVKDIRDKLNNLYTTYPELFTKEDLYICFSKKSTTSSHKNYCCNSVNKLKQIFLRISQEAYDRERK